MPALLSNPFLTALLVAALLTILVDRWERWRLARPGGLYAAADLSGVILLLALAGGLWAYLPTQPSLVALLAAGVGVFLVSAVTDQWRPSRGLRFAAAVVGGPGCVGTGCASAVSRCPSRRPSLPSGGRGRR